MENIALAVEKRNDSEIKSSASRRLRNKHYIPAVVYGLKEESVSVKIREKEFKDLLKGRSIYSLIFDMHIDGAKKNKKETVLIKEFQRDPITREFLNVDFLRIQMEKEIETTVPIHIINEEVAVGIKEGGGVLQHGLRELHISCLPADISEYIEYDIKDLDMGVTVRVSDINISDKIKILNDPEEVVVSIIHPTQLKEEEVAVEEGAEEGIVEPEVIGKEKVEPEEEKVKQKEEGHSREKDSKEK
ncbi:MAG: 50S ribosomal protein L25 [Actinobacteria bacterium]|nr:50S ribosomal protein L25 [Actinomycetota bacterium]MBU4483133.1 50S ribosomal protein L25 [Actinomycetota bacterium]MCG2791651.1 50S ribosomal protein L25 [Actinomycetes bacterium]